MPLINSRSPPQLLDCHEIVDSEEKPVGEALIRYALFARPVLGFSTSFPNDDNFSTWFRRVPMNGLSSRFVRRAPAFFSCPLYLLSLPLCFMHLLTRHPTCSCNNVLYVRAAPPK